MITTATEQELYKALEAVNEKYDGNVRFNRLPEKHGNRYHFTLRVADSKKAGARRGFSGRRMTSACWHAHGDFFDELFKINPEALVKSMGKDITAEYGNWEDRNIGSIMQPLYHSEACECEN